ncbi:hypothetical protein ACFX13_035338 [Malus domestica]
MLYNLDDSLTESTFRRRNLASWIIVIVPEVQRMEASQNTSFIICFCPSPWIIADVLHDPMPFEYYLYSTMTESISTVGPTEVDYERTLVLKKVSAIKF